MDTTLRITFINGNKQDSQSFVLADYEYPMYHRQAIADYLGGLEKVKKIEVGDGTNFIELPNNNLSGLNLANLVLIQRSAIRF